MIYWSALYRGSKYTGFYPVNCLLHPRLHMTFHAAQLVANKLQMSGDSIVHTHNIIPGAIWFNITYSGSVSLKAQYIILVITLYQATESQRHFVIAVWHMHHSAVTETLKWMGDSLQSHLKLEHLFSNRSWWYLWQWDWLAASRDHAILSFVSKPGMYGMHEYFHPT